jgi:uncharacterized repeat protein (TIGR01451 family)
MHTQFGVAMQQRTHRHQRWTLGAQLLAAVATVLLGTSIAHGAASANLAIRATAKTFQVGLPGSYVVSVVNRGPSTTDDVVTVSDTLPLGLSFASNNGAWTCSANGAAVSCTNTSPVKVGTSSTFAIFVNVDISAVPHVTNQLKVAYAGDTAPGNNTVTKVTSVRRPRFPLPTAPPTQTPPGGTPLPTASPTITNTAAPTATATNTQTPVPAATDLKLVKAVSGTFTVGSTGTYVLTVSNLGSTATNTGITVVDSLPAGLGFVSATGTGWACSAAGQTVTCVTTDVLAPAASSSITLTVSIAAAAAPTVTNTATLSYPGDTNAANNIANRPTTVRT